MKGDEAKREQFHKHEFITHTDSMYLQSQKHQKQMHQKQANQKKWHVYSYNKKQQCSKRDVPNKPDTRQHLKQFYFTGQAPPTVIYTETPKKMKRSRDFP